MSFADQAKGGGWQEQRETHHQPSRRKPSDTARFGRPEFLELAEEHSRRGVHLLKFRCRDFWREPVGDFSLPR
jgi:hypothetical protein